MQIKCCEINSHIFQNSVINDWNFFTLNMLGLIFQLLLMEK